MNDLKKELDEWHEILWFIVKVIAVIVVSYCITKYFLIPLLRRYIPDLSL